MKTTVYRLGLTGYPLGHSLSPLLHTAALDDAGLSGEYGLFPIPPLPDGAGGLEALLDEMRAGRLHGLNVTIPHKQTVLQFVDACSPAVRRVGAANVVYRSGDRLVAENTDVPAFKKDLDEWLAALDSSILSSRKALVLGAGGAARAVADVLLSEGWTVWVASRKPRQAAELCSALARSYPDGKVEPAALSKRSLRRFDFPILIVNATPAGMEPLTERCAWPFDVELPQGSLVYDLVYNPFETALIKRAKTAGLPALNGCGMLVNQAALSFSLWTGLPAPEGAMRQALDRLLPAALP